MSALIPQWFVNPAELSWFTKFKKIEVDNIMLLYLRFM